MNPTNEEYHFLKKNKRRISSFYAKEFLYDYSSDKLDEVRTKAVAETLAKDADVKLQLAKLKAAEAYILEFRKTEISESVLAEMQEKKGYFELLFEKLRMESWPKPIKLGLESLIVIFLMISVLTVTPWERISRWVGKARQNEIILTEIEKVKQTPEVPSSEPVERDEGILEQAKDSIASKESKKSNEAVRLASQSSEKTSVAVGAASKAVSQPEVPQEETKVVEKAVVEKPPAQGDDNASTSGHSREVVETKVPEKESGDVASNTKTGISEGYLYRGGIEVTNLAMTGEKIRNRIVELGGRKAGNVELGWKKQPNSMYFHFTIPENKKEELDAFLKTYNNKFNLSKEKHGRVMPDGIIRIIMTVDEKE